MSWFYFQWGSVTAHSTSYFHSAFVSYLPYHLKDFAKYKVRYKFDAKQVELVAADIKKQLTKDLLI